MKRQFSIDKCFFLLLIFINLISHTNGEKIEMRQEVYLWMRRKYSFYDVHLTFLRGMCTAQKLEVPVQELEITLQQLNRQKARQLTGHCCNWLTCTRSEDHYGIQCTLLQKLGQTCTIKSGAKHVLEELASNWQAECSWHFVKPSRKLV